MGQALRRYYRGATLAAMEEVQTGRRLNYHFDHQGTVQCLTDDTGAVTDRFASDAWGVPVKRTGTSINRQWYVGNLGYYRQVDQALDYVRARWYGPRTANWHSPDPLIASLRYFYCMNAPSIATDPTGLAPLPGKLCNGFRAEFQLDLSGNLKKILEQFDPGGRIRKLLRVDTFQIPQLKIRGSGEEKWCLRCCPGGGGMVREYSRIWSGYGQLEVSGKAPCLAPPPITAAVQAAERAGLLSCTVRAKVSGGVYDSVREDKCRDCKITTNGQTVQFAVAYRTELGVPTSATWRTCKFFVELDMGGSYRRTASRDTCTDRASSSSRWCGFLRATYTMDCAFFGGPLGGRGGGTIFEWSGCLGGEGGGGDAL